LYRYVSNNPVNLWDPLGLWTVGIGVQASGNAIQVAGGASGGIFFGYSKEKGFSWGFRGTLGAGTGLGLGGSAGGFFEFTGAQSVCDLKGKGFSVGGSGGEGITLGVSAVGGLDDNNKPTYGGLEINAGVGGGIPAEIHTIMTYTW
jgi:hypothetical protein